MSKPETHVDSLADEIASALNRHSSEQHSNTPDFILAKFLLGCLQTWDNSVRERERWYGRNPNDGPGNREALPLSAPPAVPQEPPARKHEWDNTAPQQCRRCMVLVGEPGYRDDCSLAPPAVGPFTRERVLQLHDSLVELGRRQQKAFPRDMTLLSDVQEALRHLATTYSRSESVMTPEDLKAKLRESIANKRSLGEWELPHFDHRLWPMVAAALAEAKAEVLWEVAKLPGSPLHADHGRSWSTMADWTCDWCGTGWTSAKGLPVVHPDNGCLYVRALAASQESK